MTKRLVSILVCVVLLGGLIGAYFYMQKRNAEAASPTPAPAASSAVLLIDKKIGDVKSAVFTNGGQTLAFDQKLTPNADDPSKNDVSFVVNGDENLPVMPTLVNETLLPCYYLSAYEKVTDKADDPASFGFSPPLAQAEVTYTDGSSRAIYVGMQTPAKDYYYIMLSGDDAVYLAYTYTAQRILRTFNDVADKTTPVITADNLEYVDIIRRGMDEIEFGFTGTEEERQEYLDTAALYAESTGSPAGGALPLTLIKPQYGREIYLSAFNAIVLEGVDITFGDVVEAQRRLEDIDAARYGFDDPLLALRMIDGPNEIHLIVGGDIPGESNMAYAMRYGQPVVYKIAKSALTNFLNVNVFGFMDKFVTLPNIADCEGVTIASKDKTYESVIVHELIYPTPKPAPDASLAPDTPSPTSPPQDIVHGAVNGHETDEATFKAYYRVIIGLCYDAPISEFTPSGAPDVTITFKMSDGPDIVTEYYDYNNDFYAVGQKGEPLAFVINKKYLSLLFQTSEDVLAGTFDSRK